MTETDMYAVTTLQTPLQPLYFLTFTAAGSLERARDIEIKTERERERERKAMSDCSQTLRLKSFERIETKPKFWTLVLFPFPYGHTVMTVAGNYTALP